ncbi:MAG: DUF664 domain-containing protein [Candidatus Eisenbacteria bacterium]
MDDQSRRLGEDTRGLGPAALAWQPAPGLNTAGMLLAHVAIAEVYWMQVGPLGMPASEVASVLGIGADDDGLPLPAGGLPPATLSDKDLAFYDDLLARARAHTKEVLAGLSAADLDRKITSKDPDGSARAVINLRWVLYHLVEHEAGHYGQINLLRHMYRISSSVG